jgi:hypothetical protein
MDVARKLVKRELCAEAGHDIQQNRARSVSGHLIYDFYTCAGCDATITFTYPPLEGV